MNELLISKEASINDAINLIDKIGKQKTSLFVIDENKVIGSLTDGDIRRGLINGCSIQDNITSVINKQFKFLFNSNIDVKKIQELRNIGYRYIPIVNDDFTLHDIFDFEHQKSILPIHAFLMAGGEGQRLRPLTENLPKPLLKIGEDPIIVHNIKRLKSFGIKSITIAVRYLADQIEAELGNGSKWGVNINYIHEEKALGTAGSLGLNEEYTSPTILLMNSDLLTNIDFEDMYLHFLQSNSDLTVATVPYRVDVPFAVFDFSTEGNVIGFKEKPTYNFEANSGIYLFHKNAINYIPKNEKFDATDLMETILNNQKKLNTYSIDSYWLDIGRFSDYEKAIRDIQHLKF
jgi:dTDP-glucose pyrophosphorylase